MPRRPLRLRSRLSTFLAVVIGVTGAAAALPGVPSQAVTTPLLQRVTFTAGFSPNGDGVRDRGSITYRLSGHPQVLTRIMRGNRVLARHFYPSAARGAHVFSWNGTIGHRVAIDGIYFLDVYARTSRHAAWHGVRGDVVLWSKTHHVYRSGTGTTLSSSVVYPRTTVIHDVVTASWSGRQITAPGLVRRLVYSATGRLLDSATVPCDDCQSRNFGGWTWDGRDHDGHALPAGHYVVRIVDGRDFTGNIVDLAQPRTVSVSSAQLVARTTHLNLAAQDAHPNGPCGVYDGAGCGDRGLKEGVDSDRFPRGRSYRSTLKPNSTEYAPAVDIFEVPIKVRDTPFNTFSVTAHGGPTTAGSDDVGVLSGGTTSSSTLQGDSTGTISDIKYGGGFPSDFDLAPRVLTWGFHTVDGNSYDVSSFDLTYTDYVIAH